VNDRLGWDGDAIVDYTGAIRRAPKDPQLYLSRGEVYTRNHKYVEALRDLEQAVQLDPRSAAAYAARGSCLLSARRFEEAVSDLKRARDLDPGNAEIQVLLAKAQAETGATAELKAADYNSRGRQLLDTRHFAEAIQQFGEALKRDPSLAAAHNGRGVAHLRLNEYVAAIADFDEAIRLDAAYIDAYVNRSAARRAAGDPVGADADAAKVRELSTKAGRPGAGQSPPRAQI
jgi:tetratricopeptide (TPR) repeat protein